MMEFPFKKHVFVGCRLSIGEVVKIDGWGYELNGKKAKIIDIKPAFGICQSGVLVKIDIYKNWIDSDWITKL